MVTENRQSLCGSNVRWKTVPESTASSGKARPPTVTSVLIIQYVNMNGRQSDINLSVSSISIVNGRGRSITQ